MKGKGSWNKVGGAKTLKAKQEQGKGKDMMWGNGK